MLDGNFSAFDDSEDHIRPSQALESSFDPFSFHKTLRGGIGWGGGRGSSEYNLHTQVPLY